MIVEEGLVRIITGSAHFKRGPGKSQPGFYNYSMVFSRDVMIGLLESIKKNYVLEPALDALASTGIRGIRISKEIGLKVVINDWNKECYDIIKRNLEINSVDAEVLCENAICVMARRKFGYIDIDPYGTPVPFLDAAMQSIKNRGVLGISATDTATLSGTNPSKCYRRYNSLTYRTSVKHELGIRVLLGYIAKTAAKYDKGIEPLLSIYYSHHYRVFVAVRNGAKYADESLSKIDIAETPDGFRVGPIWTGNLHNEYVINSFVVKNYFQTKKTIEKMIDVWKNEKFLFYYELSHMASKLKTSMKPIDYIIEKVKEYGYECGRTQFSPTGIRTNAPPDLLEQLLRA